MSPQSSSIQADRNTLGALAAFLATGAACSLSLFPVLTMRESLGMDGFMGWAISLGVTGVVAAMSSRPLLHAARLVVGLAGGLAIPVALIAFGQARLGGTLLGTTVLSCALAAPLVEWACGLGEEKTRGQSSSMFRFSSGRDVDNPIPSTLILGVLIFAWPGDLMTAGWAAAPFFGFTLMLASLGGMFSRVREASSGVVAVHPRFLGQWFVAGLLATLLCAGLGLALPKMVGNINGLAERRLGGPVAGGPRPRRDDQWRKSMSRQESRNEAEASTGNRQLEENAPKPKPQPQKPLSPEEMKMKLIWLLLLAAIAAAALWLLKRYNRQVLAFLKALWTVLAKPFLRAWSTLAMRRRKAKRDSAIREILSRTEDPFADPPERLSSNDVPALYDKMVADLALLGARPKAGESALAFVRRVATVYSVDKDSLFYLGHVLTEAAFSKHELPEATLQAARLRFGSLRQQIRASLAPQVLQEKQAAYRRAFAEARLEQES